MNIGIEKKNGIRIVRGNATLKTKSSWRERGESILREKKYT
jgi:hypothetical protein